MVANMRGIRSRTRSASAGLIGRACVLRNAFGAIKIGSVSIVDGIASVVLIVRKHLAARWPAINGQPKLALTTSCKSVRGCQDTVQPGCQIWVPAFASLVGAGLDNPYVYLAIVFGLRPPRT